MGRKGKRICPLIDECTVKVSADWFMLFCKKDFQECTYYKEKTEEYKTPKEWLRNE